MKLQNKGDSIVYIADARLSMHKAAIVNIMEMCNAFSKSGFKTTLVVPDCGVSKKLLFEYHSVSYPFNIINVKVPKAFLNKVIPGLLTVFSLLSFNVLRKLEYNVAFTRTTWVFFIISVIIKRHCFFEAHQFRFDGPFKTLIYRALVKHGMKSAFGRIVCISKSLMKQWQKAGIDRTKMFVAHDAVNISKFSINISKTQARQRLGFDINQSIVAYTGSLIPGKGVDVLVKCANRLPGISFVIVGGKKKQIKELKTLSKQNNVVFVGHVPPTEIPIYQAAADILALPNTKGSVIDDVTSPMKLFEYIASQRPIVATDMPSILEILKDNYNALISLNADDYRFSQNIKLLIKNPSLGEQLAKNASQDLKKYSWTARVQYLTNLFDGLK